MSEQTRQRSRTETENRSYGKVLRQGVIFGFVGVLNTAVDFGTFVLLTHFLSVYYLVAQTLSYGAGTLNSYLWNAHVTFSDSQTSSTRIPKFIILNVTVLLITLAVMHWLQFMPIYINKILSTVVGMAFNFVLSKFWVFKA